MTILIKGMEMPECCRDCELGGVYIHRDANDVYTEEKHRCSVTFYPLKDLAKRHEKCPLIEVPTPHGRLIDADELLEIGNKTGSWCNDRWHIKASAIHDAPTVIEAEKEGNNGR